MMKATLMAALIIFAAAAGETESDIEKAAKFLDDKESTFSILRFKRRSYTEKISSYISIDIDISHCYLIIANDIRRLRESAIELTDGWTREKLMKLHEDKPQEAEVFAALIVALEDARRELVGGMSEYNHYMKCLGHY